MGSYINKFVFKIQGPLLFLGTFVNNPTLGEFCFTMIGRADIEGSKSNVAMNAWLPQEEHAIDLALMVKV